MARAISNFHRLKAQLSTKQRHSRTSGSFDSRVLRWLYGGLSNTIWSSHSELDSIITIQQIICYTPEVDCEMRMLENRMYKGQNRGTHS